MKKSGESSRHDLPTPSKRVSLFCVSCAEQDAIINVKQQKIILKFIFAVVDVIEANLKLTMVKKNFCEWRKSVKFIHNHIHKMDNDVINKNKSLIIVFVRSISFACSSINANDT
jgi:hypothetical protein